MYKYDPLSCYLLYTGCTQMIQLPLLSLSGSANSYASLNHATTTGHGKVS